MHRPTPFLYPYKIWRSIAGQKQNLFNDTNCREVNLHYKQQKQEIKSWLIFAKYAEQNIRL